MLQKFKIIRDYSEIFKEIDKIAKKYGIKFKKIYYMEGWAKGNYQIPEYGIIQNVEK